MKLYIVLLSTGSNEIPQVKSYTGQADAGISHYSGEGFDVIKETENCWYLGNLPHGLPERYRKADEYKMISNGRGIYMFGEHAGLLIEKWNQNTAA